MRGEHHVVTVGGGFAGLNAAKALKRAPVRVTLIDRRNHHLFRPLLYQVATGGLSPADIATPIRALLSKQKNVQVILGEVDRSDVDARQVCLADGARRDYDTLIVATGAGPRRPGNLELGDAAQVVDAWQVLRGEVNPGASVVVADWRCDWVGLGVAERLAESGCRVRLAVNGRHAGEMIQSYVRDMMVARCHRLGVEIIPYARLHGADADTVYLEHSASGEAMLLEGVDTLVLAHGAESEDRLLGELGGYGGLVRPIGDCLAPRTAEEAVFDGLRAAWAL